MRKKRLQIAAFAIVCLMVAAALSSPGRSAIKRVLSSVTGEQPASNAHASVEPLQLGDVESRARVRHGWNTGVLNSVMRGTVTFYDGEGTNTGQATMVVYRGYPSRLRVELTRGGNTEVWGFDGLNAWRAGEPNPTAGRTREVRQWLRLCPERLFTTRSGGSTYREAGSREEDLKPGRPWQPQTRINPALLLDQVEMEDTIGLPPIAGRPGDRRRITYYVNRQDFTVEAVRWLEPDDPRRVMDDDQAALTDVRVDFGDWRRAGGVLWPFEVTRWVGGRVDIRFQVSGVLVNQALPSTIFEHP